MKYIAKNHPIKYKFIDKVPLEVLNEIKNFKNNIPKVPLVINGIEYYKKNNKYQYCPYDKSSSL